MRKIEVKVIAEEEVPWLPPSEWFGRVAEGVLRAEGVRSGRVDILICGDERIKALNREFRGEDRVTDVIAFPLKSADFPLPPRYKNYLGEIALNAIQAERQAREFGVKPLEELELLVVHGILHLLGYSDASEEERSKMRAREEEILKILRGEGDV